MVYQQQAGLLYVLGFVATRDQPTELTLTVPEGVATDGAGAANAAAATTLAYQPPDSSLGWLGTAGSAAFGGAMALSFATGIMGGGEAGRGVRVLPVQGSCDAEQALHARLWSGGGNTCLLVLLPPAGGVGIGALNFAQFAQTFYYSGSLPLTNMPEVRSGQA